MAVFVSSALSFGDNFVYHDGVNWKAWIHGLGSAFIGGGANVVATMVIDPDDFNITNGGISRIGALWMASGIVSAALYLKQSPLPRLQGETNANEGDTVHNG